MYTDTYFYVSICVPLWALSTRKFWSPQVVFIKIVGGNARFIIKILNFILYIYRVYMYVCMIYCTYKLMSLCVCVHAHFIVAIEIMILCADFVLEALRLLTTCLTVSLPRFLSLSLPLHSVFFRFSFPFMPYLFAFICIFASTRGTYFIFIFLYFWLNFNDECGTTSTKSS